MTDAIDPFKLFGDWFAQAKQNNSFRYPDAMCLSTVGDDGAPEGRIVLLKGFDERGLVFYGDTRSLKGRSLRSLPRACLNFYWDGMGRQIVISGGVAPVEEREADEYFRTRPRMHRISAWSSEQGKELRFRATLAAKVAYNSVKFAARMVPRPDYWGGYRLTAENFEFIEVGEDSICSTIAFGRKGSGWTREETVYCCSEAL